MAIPKIRARKLEISTRGLIQLGTAAALVIVSLVFGWLAFSKWRFKVNVVSGFASYATNELAAARRDLGSALWWKSDHAGARLLLAKMLLEEDKLDAAELHYQKLLEQNFDQPPVHVGMGQVHLRRADGAARPADSGEHVKRAEEAFARANPAETPEAAIGLGHCKLLLAERVGNPGDPKRFEPALQAFKKIQADLQNRAEYRLRCSPEGCLDFYMGLAKSLSSGEDAQPDAAAAAFRAAGQYRADWVLPRANSLAVETQKLLRSKHSGEDLKSLKPLATELRKSTRSLWDASGSRYPELKDPWMSYTMALARAHLDAGLEKEYDDLMRELTSGSAFRDRPEPAVFDARQWTDLALQDDPTGTLQERRVTRAGQAYGNVITTSPGADESLKATRAVGLNNQAWTEAWLGSYTGTEARLRKARENLVQAASLYPDDYVYNRNLLVVLKRLKVAEKDFQPFLDRARAAAKGPWAEDFSKLQAYLDSK